MIFGFSEQYHRVTADMIQPIGEPLTTNDAKAVYRSHMLQIGSLSQKDVAEHVRNLGDEIREMERGYREDMKDLKDEISQTRSLLKNKKEISLMPPRTTIRRRRKKISRTRSPSWR